MSLMVENRNRVLAYERDLFEIAKSKNEPDRRLNLGSGMRLLEGFTNVDKFVVAPNIDNYDIYQLPYKDNSKDLLYSSHSLEHLPIRHAKMALIDWFRVLDHDGRLVLMVPDMNAIMVKLMDEYLPENEHTWYMYTMYGYQTDMELRGDKLDLPVDPGQFHTCGFSKMRLKHNLEKIGYKVAKMFSYDGWQTPSIFVEAFKP